MAIDVGKARQALADLPEGTSHGEAPPPEHVYLPRSHIKAIDPDNPLVTGMRGRRKDFLVERSSRSECPPMGR